MVDKAGGLSSEEGWDATRGLEVYRRSDCGMFEED